MFSFQLLLKVWHFSLELTKGVFPSWVRNIVIKASDVTNYDISGGKGTICGHKYFCRTQSVLMIQDTFDQ